ncbi:hypothetical protein PYR77_07455 [Acinetobacter soli]|uniref:hypothetical protein n=1 Tax=Acinetobacter soli TaxID=487316 RepID=UPI002091BB75|nr:hypothetical protein [Acinetobacter soli]WEH93054.1 hypothetical protein PYR75_07890 [Acinetobacter soli]WEH97756.1 hypothetical protein PYR76_16185 [Acinetobacter soli]WEI01675.1 hypothetical protein PYR77_07455 [Acinetobacter soli]
MPEPPERSFIAGDILAAYNVISRSRKYEQGIPLPLGLSDISEYCAVCDIAAERWLFNECIFALDKKFMESSANNT